MATQTTSPKNFSDSRANTAINEIVDILKQVVTALASLKFTVVLLAMAIFIVLAGTFAQTKMGNWEVVDQYFRKAGFAWIEFDVFYPKAFFPSKEGPIGGGFWFPSGWMIGLGMMINLLAAHGIRFTIQARGTRLIAGFITLMVGFFVTWLVIVSGDNMDGVQVEITDGLARTLWISMAVVLVLGALGSISGLFFLNRRERKVEWWSLVVLGVLFAGLAGWMWHDIDGTQISNASMRIVWQLTKGSFAGLVLLAGCILLFKKRAGVVLLHGGIGLLMFSELLVGVQAEEGQLALYEGETANYVIDIRSVELAFVDHSDKEEDRHIVIPESRLYTGEIIDDPNYPFVVEVVQFMVNSDALPEARAAALEKQGGREPVKNPSTTGFGTKYKLLQKEEEDGLGDETNMAGAYIKIISRKEQKEDVWIFHQELKPQTIRINGVDYQASLRFKRRYLPYSVHLEDVQKNDYVGTNTPRDYASIIHIHDPETKRDLKGERIWMNNPLRYRGDTFYQSDYGKGPKVVRDPETWEPQMEFNRQAGKWQEKVIPAQERTVLSVVTNTGWMIPYVSCMIVAVGMLSHFLLTLTRFSKRLAPREDAVALGKKSGSEPSGEFDGPKDEKFQIEEQPVAKPMKSKFRGRAALDAAPPNWALYVIPILMVGVAGMYLARKATPPKQAEDQMAVYEFGKLPTTFTGRVKPMSSYAQNTLYVMSGRQTIKRAGKGENRKPRPPLRLAEPEGKAEPATAWMLDLITGKERADDVEIFRIDDPSVRSMLQLDERPKWWKYSWNQLQPRYEAIQDEIRSVKDEEKGIDIPQDDWTTRQRRTIALNGNIVRIRTMRSAFLDRHSFPTFYLQNIRHGKYDENTGDGPHQNTESFYVWFVLKIIPRIEPDMGEKVALSIPKDDLQQDWESYTRAALRLWIQRFARKHDAKTLDEFAQHFIVQMNKDGLYDIYYQQHLDGEVLTAVLENTILTFQSLAPNLSREKAYERAVRFYRGLSEEERNSIRQKMREQMADRPETIEGFEKETTKILKDNLREAFGGIDLAAEPNKYALSLEKIFNAYRDDNVEAFNQTVASYSDLIQTAASDHYSVAKVEREAYLNHASPFFYGMWIYLLGFAFACIGLLVWPYAMHRTAFGLIALTLLIHTIGLIARIYISGRPPVTNLYSSALFIGWGCVLICLIFELIFKMGIGNIVAGMTGFLTLGVAHYLAMESNGDTIAVMQAVLDTQFWLLTHVVIITLGYSTTFVAGLIGIIYIFMGIATPFLDRESARNVSRMIYGTLCFSILFSFVGTVLGGLWGDDSWGRFWGWDPKENGALIIVLWNALILHARWGGMVQDRGVAVLAVVGNIVTSWSWFGTNELQVGLHSYGFTEGRLQVLSLFMLSQLIIVAIGSFPRDKWWSFKRPTPAT